MQYHIYPPLHIILDLDFILKLQCVILLKTRCLYQMGGIDQMMIIVRNSSPPLIFGLMLANSWLTVGRH